MVITLPKSENLWNSLQIDIGAIRGSCIWLILPINIDLETTLKTTRQAFEKGIFNILFGIDHLRHDVSLFQVFRCGERVKSYAATPN